MTVVIGLLDQSLNRILRFDDLAFLLVFQAIDLTPFLDLFPPFGGPVRIGLVAALAPDTDHRLQHALAVADDRQIDIDRLVDRARIDVHMDFL